MAYVLTSRQIITRDALDSCEESFKALKAFNTGLWQADAKMKVSAKFSMIFKPQESDALRRDMSESKASLNLVVVTLQIIITMRFAASNLPESSIRLTVPGLLLRTALP